MTRYNVICAKCDEQVMFRNAGDVCEDVHDSPYIVECDCTGIPVSNWNDVETPEHWKEAERVI